MEEVRKTFVEWLNYTQQKSTDIVPVENGSPRKKKMLLVGFEGNKSFFAKEVIFNKLGENLEIDTLSYMEAKKELFDKIKGGSYDIVMIGCVPHKIKGVENLQDLEEFSLILMCTDGNGNLASNKSAVKRALDDHLKEKTPE